MGEDIGLFEAISTLRAIRRFAPDPVPDEVIHKIIEAATHATSGGNRQPWYFLVIRDPEVKKRVGEIYWKATSLNRERGLHRETPTFEKTRWDMAQHIGESPALILVCVEGEQENFGLGSSIYPAIQLLMLAARGLGLGTVYTSNYRRFEKEVKELLGIPHGIVTAALIPLGYPGEGEHFGGARRKPVEEVTFYDRWGASPSGKVFGPKEREGVAHRLHMDVLQKGNLDVVDEIVASKFINHSQSSPKEWRRGPAGVKKMVVALRAAFPNDIMVSHEEAVTSGDLVAIRWTLTGTQDGPILGIPATGKPVILSGTDIYRVWGGKIWDLWQNWDRLDLLQQIGAAPQLVET